MLEVRQQVWYVRYSGLILNAMLVVTRKVIIRYIAARGFGFKSSILNSASDELSEVKSSNKFSSRVHGCITCIARGFSIFKRCLLNLVKNLRRAGGQYTYYL